MLIYLIMFLVSEMFAVLAVGFKKRKKVALRNGKLYLCNYNFSLKKLFYFLSAVPFLLVAVLRYKVGTDYTVYSNLQIPEVMRGINDRVEFLYRYVIKIGMAIGGVQWVFVITHVFIILFIWLYMRDSENLCISIFVFMFSAAFNISMNIMRQYIAIAICAYAIKYIEEKKLIKFCIWVFIAFLFHSTAIIFLLIYPLSKIKMKGFMPLIISIGSFSVTTVARRLLEFVIGKLDLYTKYLSGHFDQNDTQYDFILLEFVILSGGCLINYLYDKNNHSMENNSYIFGELSAFNERINLYTGIQFLTCLFACFSGIIPNSTRIILIPAIGQLIYIPMILKRCRKMSERLYYVMFVGYFLIYLVIFWRLIVQKDMGETYVYHSILTLNH